MIKEKALPFVLDNQFVDKQRFDNQSRNRLGPS